MQADAACLNPRARRRIRPIRDHPRGNPMTRTRTALLLTLALATTPALAQQDVSTVNGSVSADAGQAYGDLETVNGSVSIAAGATVEDASTVNGSITVGDVVFATLLDGAALP